jgi:subtilase family serine protease
MARIRYWLAALGYRSFRTSDNLINDLSPFKDRTVRGGNLKKPLKLGIKAALLTSATFCLPAFVVGGPSQLTTYAPVHAAKSKLAGLGAPVAAEQEAKPISITVYLKLRNEEELDDLIAEQKTPGSAYYEHYLTPEEFHSRFSPLPADLARVRSELTRLGFKVLNTANSGLYVSVAGTVGLVKTAFHISQDLYRVGGKTVRSYREEPMLPASISDLVLHIGGLDGSHAFIHPMIKIHRSDAPQVAGQFAGQSDPGYFNILLPSPCNVDYGPQELKATLTPAPAPYAATLPFGNCGYVAKQLQTAYGVNKVSQSGLGMRIGIVDMLASPTIEGDLNKFSKINGLPPVNYSNFIQILPPGVANGPDYTPCGIAANWALEESLDVEAAHSIAPNASIIYFGGACANNDPLPDVALYDAIDTRMADVVSNSWGEPEFLIPEGQFKAGDQAFKEAAVLGVTVLVSSGDAGDFIAEGAILSSASWPASSPYVTAVGGTSLILNHDGTKSEYPWGNNLNDAYQNVWTGPFQIAAGGWYGWRFAGGSGGGRSLFYSQPSFQKSVVPKSLSYYEFTFVGTPVDMGVANRVLPDISMVADPDTAFNMGETFVENTNGTVDPGCFLTDAAKDREFCQFPIGGTSLASPAMAGVLALVGEARLHAGKAPIGFANPDLYKLKFKKSDAIREVMYPKSPQALVIQYPFPYNLFSVSLDSAPDATGKKVVEGAGDSTLSGGQGYNSTAGLGAPWVPALIKALE